jgi:hypothetical protein
VGWGISFEQYGFNRQTIMPVVVNSLTYTAGISIISAPFYLRLKGLLLKLTAD